MDIWVRKPAPAAPVEPGDPDWEGWFDVSVSRCSAESFIVGPVLPVFPMQILKAMIMRHTGTPKAQQQLMFGDKILDNEKTLKDYNIQKDSTLQLVVLAVSDSQSG